MRGTLLRAGYANSLLCPSAGLVLVVNSLERANAPKLRQVAAVSATGPRADAALPAGLVDALRGPGRAVTVDDVGPPGLPDWRVCISSGDSDACVELLGPLAGIGNLPWWHAVRITPDGRTVVRGPAHESPIEQVVAFVEDVLAGDRSRAKAHWTELG